MAYSLPLLNLRANLSVKGLWLGFRRHALEGVKVAVNSRSRKLKFVLRKQVCKTATHLSLTSVVSWGSAQLRSIDMSIRKEICVMLGAALLQSPKDKLRR